MKVSVRYQSRGGNTKAVAETIAQLLNTEALTIDNPIEEYTDILFLGGGVYSGKMDKNLRIFIEQLSPKMVGQIVAFSTAGTQKKALTQIRQTSEQKKIPVNEHELLIKMFIHGYSVLGPRGGKLTDTHRKDIATFIEEIEGAL